MSANRRKMERFELRLLTTIRIQDPAMKNRTDILYSRDISSSGVFLLTDNPLPLGTEVNLAMIFSQDFFHEEKTKKIKLNTTGKIIRTDENGQAVFFDKEYRITTLKQAHRG